MEFSRKKLPPSAASEMRRCAVPEMSAYEPLLGPAYVYMRRNEKFVAVKGPLDFFSKSELARFSPIEDFFFEKNVERALPFCDAARAVHSVLNWQPRVTRMEGIRFKAPPLQPAPYELSDAIVRILGPLWGEGLVVDPFYMSAFSTELCGPFEESNMIAARERGVEKYEIAVLRAGFATWFALHLGWIDYELLKKLRQSIFNWAALDSPPQHATHWQMAEVLEKWISGTDSAPISWSEFSSEGGRLSNQLRERMSRIGQELVKPGTHFPSVRDPGGFIDG